jgi:uncharacterized protein
VSWRTARIVGNDIAHAVPLTPIACLDHVWLGTVNWPMLAWMLVGSLPGFWSGANRFKSIPESWLRGGLSLLFVYAGVSLVLI